MFGSSESNRDGPKLKAIISILSGLGELPVAERMDQLTNVLSTVEGTTLSGRKRIQTLESCRDPILAIAEDVQQSCIVQSLPVGNTEFKRVKKALDLVSRLANLYASSVSDNDANKKIIRLTVHRELELREIYLVLSALAYIPLPANFWRTVHSTIHRADNDGVTKFKPSGADNRLSLTTGQIYVAIVLIGQSDPYQLGFREILRVREVATLLANRVDLIADNYRVDPEVRRYVFLVDEKLGQPAMPWGTGKEGRLPEGSMVLDVTDVITRIRRTYKSLCPHSVKFDATFPEEPKQVIMGFYEHLLTLWAKQPIRSGDRISKISGYKLCVGLDDITKLPQLINPDGSIANVDEIILSDSPESYNSYESLFIDVRSHDLSDGGIRFVVHGGNSKRVAAGEVVAYCQQDHGTWYAGLIRWVRGSSAGRAECGVQVLGEFAGVCTIRHDTPIDESVAPVEAVLVRDTGQQQPNYWVIEAATSNEILESSDTRLTYAGEIRETRPLNRRRRTPYVTYQYAEIADVESKSAAAR